MRLTLSASPALGPSDSARSVTLDLRTRALLAAGARQAGRVTAKARALVMLLASRRLGLSSGSSLGWVDLSEVEALAEWAGRRTRASLAAQVRREVKSLHRVCPDLIETPADARLHGPFRLACVPRCDKQARLAIEQFSVGVSRLDGPRTADALYSWLERSEPVWRALHFFDKPGEALSNLPALDDEARLDPLLHALSLIGTGRRLRDMGAFGRALRALDTAAVVARTEPYAPIRLHLQTLCALQQGWVHYRMGKLDQAERCVAAADLTATTGAHLRLRGQVLSLRSLIQRSRRRYAEALKDLAEAARLFILDGDLFQLFAVYHNLACLIAAQAQSEADPSRRDDMFRRALSYSQRNEGYCRRYGVGHNSVLNKLLQVGLHRELGSTASALRIATEAERTALESQNFPEAIISHRHRVSILLRSGAESEARRVHRAAVAALPERQLARRFEQAYKEEVDEWLRSGSFTGRDQSRSRGRTRR